jgi:hypothetical protein
MAAYPTFRRILAEESGETGWKLEAIFGYLIHYGEAPATPTGEWSWENARRTAAIAAWFARWQSGSVDHLTLDRFKLMKLFKELTNRPSTP